MQSALSRSNSNNIIVWLHDQASCCADALNCLTPDTSSHYREEGRKPEANGAFALDASVGPQRLRAILAAACDFAAEWAELRSVFQSRLYGCVLRWGRQQAHCWAAKASTTSGHHDQTNPKPNACTPLEDPKPEPNPSP